MRADEEERKKEVPAVVNDNRWVMQTGEGGGVRCACEYLGKSFVPRHRGFLHQHSNKKTSSVLVMWQNPHTETHIHIHASKD